MGHVQKRTCVVFPSIVYCDSHYVATIHLLFNAKDFPMQYIEIKILIGSTRSQGLSIG